MNRSPFPVTVEARDSGQCRSLSPRLTRVSPHQRTGFFPMQHRECRGRPIRQRTARTLAIVMLAKACPLLPRIFQRREPSTFKHSSRSRPLQLSMSPFSTERPGQMKHNCTSCPIAQASSARLQNSLPLSTVMLSGKLHRSCFARSSACATFIPIIASSKRRSTLRCGHDRGARDAPEIDSFVQIEGGR